MQSSRRSRVEERNVKSDNKFITQPTQKWGPNTLAVACFNHKVQRSLSDKRDQIYQVSIVFKVQFNLFNCQIQDSKIAWSRTKRN